MNNRLTSRRARVALVIAAAVAVAIIVAAASGGDSSEETAGTTPAGLGESEWGTYSYSYEQTRYVPFTKIDKDNLDELGRVFTVDFQKVDPKVPGGQQNNPLMVDGVLYVTTSFNHVFAVDAKTGKVRWHFAPSRIGAFKNFGVTANRGVAYGDGKLYMLTLDMRVIALDAKTGKLVKEAPISEAIQDARPEFGYYESAAPIYYKGKLLIGSSGGDSGIRGFVMAYNADDLTPAWEQPYWTVPPEGQDWRSRGRFHGGGAVWTPVTIDAETDTAYFSVANPSPDFYPQLRPGPNPKTNSVVAVDVNTGREKWWRQQLPNDSWDYDTAASPVVATAQVNGAERKVVSVGTKEGVWFAYDAETGKPIYERVQIIDKVDHPKLVPGRPVDIYPSAVGGHNYAPAAYNPQTNLQYIASIQSGLRLVQARSAAEVDRNRIRGDVDLGALAQPIPGYKDYGLVTAIDMDTGKVAWKVKTPQPERGGVTTTAGGLAFVGGGDGVLRALDAESGDVLWTFQTGAQIAGGPTIYELDGKEYLAITTGGSPQTSSGGKLSRLEVFALGGDTTQSKAPQITAAGADFPRAQEQPTQQGYLSFGRKPRTLELSVVGSQGTVGGGMNFNGYAKGEMVVRVPRGYRVEVTFRNASAQIPHSVMVTAMGQVERTQGFTPAFSGAMIKNPEVGITAGTQRFSFTAGKTGRYALLCAVPGHAVAGMWDTLEVVPADQTPSITLGAKTITLERR